MAVLNLVELMVKKNHQKDLIWTVGLCRYNEASVVGLRGGAVQSPEAQTGKKVGSTVSL